MAFILLCEAASAQVCLEPYSRPSYPTRKAFCSTGESVVDAYQIGQTILCEEMEVDHLISLRQAWHSGVCGEDLKRFANDRRNLRFTYWLTNRKKGYLSPEDFATQLPDELAERVILDSQALMRDYGIRPREEAILYRMQRLAELSVAHARIPISSISSELFKKFTFRTVGGKTIVFIGKKAIGLAVGAGAVIEFISVAGWAEDLLTTPNQSSRMAARAEMLRAIMRDTQ